MSPEVSKLKGNLCLRPSSWHAKGELDGEPKDDLTGAPSVPMHGEPEGEQ